MTVRGNLRAAVDCRAQIGASQVICQKVSLRLDLPQTRLKLEVAALLALRTGVTFFEQKIYLVSSALVAGRRNVVSALTSAGFTADHAERGRKGGEADRA